MSQSGWSRQAWMAAVIGAALGCGACRDTARKDEAGGALPTPPQRAASTDPLWKLGPAEPTVAVVVADGALGRGLSGLATVVERLERAPATRPFAEDVRAKLTFAGVALAGAKLEDIGLDPGGGAAYFATASGPVLVLPVADRARLLAAARGSAEAGIDRLGGLACRPVAGRYLCAPGADQLDELARGPVYSPIDDWSPELRGDVEVYTAQVPGLAEGLVIGSVGVRVGARLERGGVDLRAHVTGRASGWLGMAETGVASPLLARVDEAASGLFVVKAAGFWRSVLPSLTRGLPAGRLPGGATPAQLLESMDGDMIGWSMPGEDERFTVLVGLSRQEPVRRLLGACGPVVDGLPGLVLEKKGGRCLATVDPTLPVPEGLITLSLSAEAWVDDGALRIDVGRRAAGSPPAEVVGPPATFARQLRERAPLLGLWGQGSVVGSELVRTPAEVDSVRLGSWEAASATAALLYRLRELGFWLQVQPDGLHAAMRLSTTWAYPDDVAAEVDAVIDEVVDRRVEARRRMALLAAKYPDSPLARDQRAGGGWSAMAATPILAFGGAAMLAIQGYRDRAEAAKGEGPEDHGARALAGRLGRRRGELIRDLVRGLERSGSDCRAMAAFVRRFHASRGAEIARIHEQLGETPATYAELAAAEQHAVIEPLGARLGAVLDPCAEDPELSTALRSLGLP